MDLSASTLARTRSSDRAAFSGLSRSGRANFPQQHFMEEATSSSRHHQQPLPWEHALSRSLLTRLTGQRDAWQPLQRESFELVARQRITAPTPEPLQTEGRCPNRRRTTLPSFQEQFSTVIPQKRASSAEGGSPDPHRSNRSSPRIGLGLLVNKDRASGSGDSE